jgi:WD repeat-containing protein 26
MSDFPRIATAILPHDGQIWNVSWSNDGASLASGGEDHKVTIWQQETEVSRIDTCNTTDAFSYILSKKEIWSKHFTLEHDTCIFCISRWSSDDSTLLTCSDTIKMWGTKVDSP